VFKQPRYTRAKANGKISLPDPVVGRIRAPGCPSLTRKLSRTVLKGLDCGMVACELVIISLGVFAALGVCNILNITAGIFSHR
jgi:hypothetical protein